METAAVTAIPTGLVNPETREALTVAPDVVYSPIVPLPSSATNRSDPNTARKRELANPEMREAFTVAPDVLYSPITAVVSLLFT